MPTPVTSSDLVDLIRSSGVLDDARIDGYLRSLPQSPAKAAELAQLMEADGLITAFQKKQFLLGRRRGLVMGQHVLLEVLGRGGNGIVFLAEHRRMRRRAAVKVLPVALARNREILERFYREARAAGSLDHPNIVRAHDIDRDGDVHFLVMEYVEGPNLQDYVASRGRLPYEEAAALISQVAAGLDYAHSKGMIHRDIKPANLLLDRDGVVKILDMGLARVFQDSFENLTPDLCGGAILGTADYLSPEQAMDCHDVDHRSDIYSLGATFYTLLNGTPPFHGTRLGRKLIELQTIDPVPIHVAQPSVPVELSAVVMRMLAKNPADRFANCGDVVAALQKWYVSSLMDIQLASYEPGGFASTRVAPAEQPATPGAEKRLPPRRSMRSYVIAAVIGALLPAAAISLAIRFLGADHSLPADPPPAVAESDR